MRVRIPAGFDMNVNILTSGYWPSYPIIDAKMPGELNDYQQVRVLMPPPCQHSQNKQAAAVLSVIVSHFPNPHMTHLMWSVLWRTPRDVLQGTDRSFWWHHPQCHNRA